jgi:YVTN family beta-propeller protein
MTDSTLIQLAQSGDATAIATLMNTTLQAIGVQARVVVREGVLHVLLESERILAQAPCTEFIRRGILRLGLAWLSTAVVYSRIAGEHSPAWVEQIHLKDAAIANPFELPADAALEAITAIIRLPKRQPVRLFNLLLLCGPILVVLLSGLIWNRYLVYNPAVIGRSVEVTLKSQEDTDPYAKALGYANSANLRGKSAITKAEWRRAIDGWTQAIAVLKTIPPDAANAAIAQQKIQEYQGNVEELMRDRIRVMGMELQKTIHGGISPKSVAYSGKDLFFVQNMMYGHTITVYDRDYNLVKTISDGIKLAEHGYPQFHGSQNGAPVEAAFSQRGQVAWVSNYQMYGQGFNSTADDDCSPSQNQDSSFLYRINTSSLNIEDVVQVGAVPKFVATAPDNQVVLVSNWCSWDVSVVSPQQNKEIRRIPVGPYPRGIAVDAKSEKAYVAVMGSYDVAVINLKTFAVDWLKDIGRSPRHLNLDPSGQFLYATLNGEGKVAKIDLSTGTVVSKVVTGDAPRSMALSGDGQFLYVVNYNSDTISKVRTQEMQVVQSVKVDPAPIGVTYDPKKHQVWVACYSGSILVFQD